MDHYGKISHLVLNCEHLHGVTRGKMSIWNYRRCNPACKVMDMVSVQNQMEYLPIVFQVQFNTRQRPIICTSTSGDASPTRHKQYFNLTGRADEM